jgi:hypothetical protein
MKACLIFSDKIQLRNKDLWIDWQLCYLNLFLRRPRRKWEDNIRMDVTEIVWEGVWNGFIWLRIRISGGLL